jgi:pimeloyl-ACP methyl ester carboxylesterase
MRATALLLVAFAMATAVQPAQAAGTPPTITWEPCAEDPTVQCGSVQVPVDWSRPHGPTLELAVYRRPASDPAARTGSLVTGYPLAPGLALIGPDSFQSFSAEITRRFDIVSWDPRGVGDNPVRCSAQLANQLLNEVTEAAPIPADQTELDRIEQASRRLLDDCRQQTGPLHDQVHGRNDVRDLDTIRAALGEDQLTYYGTSLGTLTGQQYAELFPHRVRAIVLDGVVDHSLDTRGWWRAQATGMQVAFDEFAEWSDRTPASALHGRDVHAVWRDLLARTDAGQVPSAADPPRPAQSRELINLAYLDLTDARWVELTQLLATVDAGAPVPAPTPDAGQDGVIDFPLVQRTCEDFRLPVRDYPELARLLRGTERITPDLRFPPDGLTASLACLGASDPPGNPQDRLDVRHAATPLLLVNSAIDPNTSYRMATNVSRQLGRNGVLLTYDGPGHSLYHQQPVRGSDCVDTAVDRYLLTQTLPPAGTHCPAVEPGQALSGQE